MGAIRLLPPEIVNRIAAGEVIERPASVLKELVENSLDAGATRVGIALEEGGKSLIRVSDDGSGIAREDLPLAFASHSTSKLADAHIAADLFGIETLGFRGEALASIQAVAMVSVVSRTPGSEHAWEYRPGEGEPRPAAREVGTTVEVRNLFHNVPARRKFLRSGATELSHAVQLFTRLAISFPGVRFELVHGEKRLYLLPAVEELRERLRQLLGGEALEGLVEVRADAGGLPSIRGFVGDPRVSRRDARDQHFFVNGRWVRDRMLAHALREAYEGLQIPGNQPVAYLFLDVAPDEVDVNVHPTKAEVRFREPSQIYSLVRGAVREAVGGPRGAAAGTPRPGAPLGSPLGARSAAPAGPSYRPRSPLEDAFDEFLSRSRSRRPPRAFPSGARSGARPETEAPAVEAAPPGLRAFQVLGTYIVVEASGGLAIVDQHAFHEKIIFEEVLDRLKAGRLEKQRLLVPQVVDVPPDLFLVAERAAKTLDPLGFEVEPFGTSALAVRAFPSILDREAGPTDLAAIVRGALESLREAGEEEAGARLGALDATIRRVAAAIACRRAVKAGAELSEAEIGALLARGARALDPGHCPHGRPTAVFFSREDIEREFDRR